MVRTRTRVTTTGTFPYRWSERWYDGSSSEVSGSFITRFFERTRDSIAMGLHGSQYLTMKRAAYRYRREIRNGPPWLAALRRRQLPDVLSTMALYEKHASGGGFLAESERHTVDASPVSLTYESSYVKRNYSGLILPFIPPEQPYWDLLVSSSDELDIVGAGVVAATRPTKPGGNVATLVLELREGIPKMLGAAIKKHGLGRRSLAEEHLNYQFGIAPLVTDLNELVKAFESSDQRWSQLVRDSGRRTRRRRDLGTTTDSKTTETLEMVHPSQHVAEFCDPYGKGTRRMVETTECHRWFSGAFQYYLPLGNDPFSRFRARAAKWRMLYGLDMSLETVYELAPWSWLFEWVASVQNALGNAVALTRDDLVLEYGYLMEHKVRTRTHDLRVKLTGRGHYHAQYVSKRETKYRVPANPYGFGIDFEGLSTRQLSILAALGITRGSRRAVSQ